MSNNQKLFKDAIADAKTLREVAVANAKAALEESFMPRIQSMFEKRIMENEELEEAEEELKEKATYIVDKDNLIDSLDENEDLEEGEDDSMEEEIDLEELFNSLSEEDNMYEMDSELSEEDLEEDYDLEEILRELEEESNEIYEEEEMEEGMKDDLNENTMFEKASGKENIDEVTVDELRDMIQDAIRAVMGGEEGVSGEEMDFTMDDEAEEGPEHEAGETEEFEAGEEEEEGESKKKSKKDELDELYALYEKKKEELEERRKYKGGSKKDDLDESAEAVKGAPFGKGGAKSKIGAPYGAAGPKKSGVNGAYSHKLSMKLNEKSKDLEEVEDVEEVKKMKDDLEEAINVIKTLRGQLNEVNLLNAKLIYVNKIFKANQLTENQKVNVVNSFDKAQTLNEAKNIYEVLKNTVKTSKVSPKTTLKEHKSFASSVVGGTTAKSPIISADDTITRMQQLAGIITK